MDKIESKNTSPTFHNYFSENQFSWNITGVMEADNGDYKSALESFSKAIELDPKKAVSYFNRASIKMHLGDIQGARRDFKLSEELDIKNQV